MKTRKTIYLDHIMRRSGLETATVDKRGKWKVKEGWEEQKRRG